MRTAGKFFKWWQVNCGGCGMASPLLSAPLLSIAAKLIRKDYGWKQRNGLWRCPNCAKENGK